MKRWWKIVFAHKHSVDCVILTGTNHRFVYYETYWRMMNRTFCVSLSIDNVSCGFDLIQFPMGILHLWESVGILIHSYGTVSIRFFLDSQLVLVMKNRFDKKWGWLGGSVTLFVVVWRSSIDYEGSGKRRSNSSSPRSLTESDAVRLYSSNVIRSRYSWWSWWVGSSQTSCFCTTTEKIGKN